MPVLDPLTEGDAVTPPVELGTALTVCLALDDAQKLFTGLTDISALVLTDTLDVFVPAIERVPQALTVLVRLLVVLAVVHTEAVEVFDTVDEAELVLDTVLVFDIVAEEVYVWLADPLIDTEPLDEVLAELLLRGELETEAELLTLYVALPDPDTDSLPLSLYERLPRLLGEGAEDLELAPEKLSVTVTVRVTPVGNVVSLTVRVAGTVPETLTVLDLVLTGDTEPVTEPVDVLDEVLDPVIVDVLYIVRVPTTLDVVHGLPLLVLDGPGARDNVPEPLVVFELEEEPVKLTELLEDLL